MRLAVISDTHFDPSEKPVLAERRGEIADILLLRTVHRLNRLIKPDVTLFLGDVVDDGWRIGANQDFERIRQIVDLLESPLIVIPGNHDADPQAFYSVFPRPAEMVDISGVRFLPFIDPEEPGCNARRTQEDLERMAAARSGWDGPIVTLQHVPIFPPGMSPCPYNYVNVDEVIATMQRYGITLALSGHYHEGFDLIRNEHADFVAVPALCEMPFAFLEIDMQPDHVSAVRHKLRLPEKMKLCDSHIHTSFAYCSENMDIPKTLELARDFGLAGVVFSEHSGHLYFDRDAYGGGDCLAGGITSSQDDNRFDDYMRALVEAGCNRGNCGIEADCCFDGTALIHPEDRAQVSYVAGAIHQMPSLRTPQPDIQHVCDEFLFFIEQLLQSGVDVLAHPFRIFRRSGLPIPESLFLPTIKMLRQSGVAAEINFHTNEPPPEFFRLCIDAGVRLSLGSDAHNLYEVGEFAPHLELLRSLGVDGNLEEVLRDSGAARLPVA